MARGLVFATLWGLQLAIVVVFASPAWMRDQVEGETAAVERYLGAEAAEDLTARSEALFRLLLVDSGAMEAVRAAFLPQPGQQLGGRDVPVLFDWMERVLNTLWLVCYQMIFRALLLADWVPSLGVVIGAAIVDGAVSRNIKKSARQYANPVRYRAAIRTLVALLIVPLFYLSLPFSVSPVVVPGWFLCVAAAVMLGIANAQHRI